ncbi:heavy-metal-associated domain-containing protein [Pleurocapsa sp. PCC 7319]|uniref:heavy-metal-associated domain-containing protein n=1 Tax=Pleurocapsa sp. PCC 7319 TaxID=118161 RepID=UPI0004764A35|nr:heavy-metal-associated domain-containing protein [Pleurocapsa sp. PCC 7319]
MTINLQVPSMVCDGCVTTVTEAITTHEPEAKVEINLDTKQVKVETNASEESIKQIITAAGHTVE